MGSNANLKVWGWFESHLSSVFQKEEGKGREWEPHLLSSVLL